MSVSALSAALLLAIPFGSASAQAELATVRIQSQAFATQISAEASIEALNQATLAAQMPGRIIDLSVDVGDRVRKGQVLLRIDPAEAAAVVAAADAAVAQAEASLLTARAEYERARSLVARQFLSQSALDSARSQFQAADAQLRAARAQRTQATTVEGYATVVSPLDGVVAARHIEAGEMAQPGRTLLTVYDPARMRAVADLSPQRLAQLGEGVLRATVELNGSRRMLEAAAVTVLPAADARTHTRRLRIDLPPGTEGVQPGSFARVHFHSAPASVASAAPVLIPVVSVLRRGELSAVYVAEGEGRFSLRQVRLGRTVQDGTAVEVLSGLKGDETLALDPVQAGIQTRAASAAR
ncbi:efflux RND transporter periplasmic adaptor subunit [Thauera terpenica]|nr:efflux RND transporter periplasmic adaptor subunit [Thauera terpenica]